MYKSFMIRPPEAAPQRHEQKLKNALLQHSSIVRGGRQNEIDCLSFAHLYEGLPIHSVSQRLRHRINSHAVWREAPDQTVKNGDVIFTWHELPNRNRLFKHAAIKVGPDRYRSVMGVGGAVEDHDLRTLMHRFPSNRVTKMVPPRAA
jgi:hypothetical protein